MKKSGAILCAVLGAVVVFLALSATPARALPYTYDFTFTDADSPAKAVGTITFDSLYFTGYDFNPAGGAGPSSYHEFATTSYVTALSLTVTGSAVTNGTYTMADFSGFILDTNFAELDFTKALIGQLTPEGPWGPASGIGDFGLVGSPFSPNSPPGLGGDLFSMLISGPGEFLTLDGNSSFGNPTSGPVPEPATLLLFGSGLAGIGAFRRKYNASRQVNDIDHHS